MGRSEGTYFSNWLNKILWTILGIMTQPAPMCSRRMFLLGTATTFAGAFLAACGTEPDQEVAATEVPVGSSVILGSVIIAQPTEATSWLTLLHAHTRDHASPR